MYYLRAGTHSRSYCKMFYINTRVLLRLHLPISSIHCPELHLSLSLLFCWTTVMHHWYAPWWHPVVIIATSRILNSNAKLAFCTGSHASVSTQIIGRHCPTSNYKLQYTVIQQKDRISLPIFLKLSMSRALYQSWGKKENMRFVKLYWPADISAIR